MRHLALTPESAYERFRTKGSCGAANAEAALRVGDPDVQKALLCQVDKESALDGAFRSARLSPPWSPDDRREIATLIDAVERAEQDVAEAWRAAEERLQLQAAIRDAMMNAERLLQRRLTCDLLLEDADETALQRMVAHAAGLGWPEVAQRAKALLEEGAVHA